MDFIRSARFIVAKGTFVSNKKRSVFGMAFVGAKNVSIDTNYFFLGVEFFHMNSIVFSVFFFLGKTKKKFIDLLCLCI